MEARVNELRPSRSKGRAERKQKADEVDDDTSSPLEDDKVEPGLDVPNSVLDGCEKSFIAADGDRIKHQRNILMTLDLLKWDFIPEWEGHIEFGVSVFHAYGHQWTYGEGCERFWSQLKRLIPGLRVTGYHCRLFILDIQAEHITKSKLVTVGRWLKDWVNTVRRWIAEGEEVLHERPEGISKQTSCPPVQEQWGGLDRLYSCTPNTEASLKEQLKELSAELEGLVQNSDTWALQDEINDSDLQWLKKSAWLNKQLNICVVLDQLLVKLRVRKFELANLDWGHTSRELDNQHRDHIEKATKGRERGIQATIRAYERLRKDMMMMRGKDGVAKDAYIPPEITNSVYKLDVDEDIWLAQSTEGLAQFPGGVVPAWLSDASVRVGIRAAQEVVNCKEELKRCAAEHSNLRQWVETEYLATQFVLNHSADRLHWFFDIVSMWQKDLDGVPFEGSGGSISTFLPEIPPPIPGMDTWDHAKDEEGCGRSDANIMSKS
ncbi:hypothetical protein BS47DRAFT_1369185 [Hydnum rufescens UP504]|uniref:Uncharacterized protein n=2 Tax=Hydnum rufescens UP504 TaxID=1448309 RepID=A0A9P6ADG2_9AGAM|nr:hypothetical protein BS47DRAFT_1369185 [Hydnum rufescens UP504]